MPGVHDTPVRESVVPESCKKHQEAVAHPLASNAEPTPTTLNMFETLPSELFSLSDGASIPRPLRSRPGETRLVHRSGPG